MRIAYVNPQSVPDTLPSTLQILQTADALGEAGAQVDLVTPEPPAGQSVRALLGRDLHPNVTLHPLPDWRGRWFFPFSSNRPFYWMARRWVARMRPDVLYVRNLKLAETLLSTGIPLVMETHELFAQSFVESHGAKASPRKLAALAAREARVYQNASGLITITHALLEDIQARYHPATPALVAPDGVDLVLANQATPQPPHTPARLLYLGSLHPWKGVETLIAALPHVHSATLCVAGGNAERIQALRDQARALHCEAKVEFLGPVPPVERFHHIARADICLLPLTDTSIASRYTSPLKLFEYMALGRAILCADHPALREVLTHGKNAYLVPAQSPTALAEAINLLSADPALRQRLGQHARDDAQHYSWQARARHILAFLHTLSPA